MQLFATEISEREKKISCLKNHNVSDHYKLNAQRDKFIFSVASVKRAFKRPLNGNGRLIQRFHMQELKLCLPQIWRKSCFVAQAWKGVFTTPDIRVKSNAQSVIHTRVA